MCYYIYIYQIITYISVYNSCSGVVSKCFTGRLCFNVDYHFWIFLVGLARWKVARVARAGENISYILIN